MARVNAYYEIPHPNEAVPPLQTGLHVGRDGVAQMLLSEDETAWMKNVQTDSVLHQIASEQERRNSILYLYGHESTFMTVLLVAIMFLVLVFVVRLCFACLSRVFRRNQR